MQKKHLKGLLKDVLSNVPAGFSKTVEPVKLTTIHRYNKGKKWKYGYNKEQDLVDIRRQGRLVKSLRYRV